MVAIEHLQITGEAKASSRRFAFSITIERAIFALFVAGLAWVPYWFGSNRVIAWGINAGFFAGLAAVYEFSLLLRGMRHPVPLQRVRLPAVLFVTVAVWVVLQNVTWVPAAWQHPIW